MRGGDQRCVGEARVGRGRTEQRFAFRPKAAPAIMGCTCPVSDALATMSTEAAATVATPPPAAIDESNLIRSVIRLAWPVVVQQVSFSMVQLVDTALVGHLGEDALAGVRLGGQIFWFSQSGMIAIAVGSTAIIARNVGAGNAHLASRTLQNAILMALAWGVLVGLAMWFLGSWSLGALGAEAGARHEGTTYLKAAAIGMPFWSMVFAGKAPQPGAGGAAA